MLHAVYRLGSSDSIGVVGIGIIIKGLELPALFPGQGVAEIGGRIALRVIGDGLPIVGGKQVFPHAVAVGINRSVYLVIISYINERKK